MPGGALGRARRSRGALGSGAAPTARPKARGVLETAASAALRSEQIDPKSGFCFSPAGGNC